MWLNVCIIGTEQLFCTINGELFNNINVLATTVVALSGIAFGVFIGWHRTLCLHYRRAGVVFRCNQLNMLFLALGVFLHRIKKLGVKSGKSQITAEHSGPLESTRLIK